MTLGFADMHVWCLSHGDEVISHVPGVHVDRLSCCVAADPVLIAVYKTQLARVSFLPACLASGMLHQLVFFNKLFHLPHPFSFYY